MGWSVTIGEAVLEECGGSVYVAARPENLPDAPLFPGDPTGRTNGRSPSYSTWADFESKVRLQRLFGKWREVEGTCARLLPEHSAAIRYALSTYTEEMGGDKVPGWCEGTMVDCTDTCGHDPTLARLLWLDWWVSWALRNCDIPVIEHR